MTPSGPPTGRPTYADSGTRSWDAAPVGVMQRLHDIDARGGSVLPASTETKRDYLERLAAGAPGVVGSGSVRVGSGGPEAAPDHRRTRSQARRRRGAQRVTCPSLRISRRTSLRMAPVVGMARGLPRCLSRGLAESVDNEKLCTEVAFVTEGLARVAFGE